MKVKIWPSVINGVSTGFIPIHVNKITILTNNQNVILLIK